jgi:aminoglycoside phosphotransferase (APT) family kinase protein
MFLNNLPYAVFDWDAAEIGDPLNDVAYALWMWCRIGSPENSPLDVGKMVNIILDSYGLKNEIRKSVIDKIHEQIKRVEKSMVSFLLTSRGQQKALTFQQWTNECNSWLYKYQNQIVTYFTI